MAALRSAPAVPSTVSAVAAAIVSGSDGHDLAARNADARLAPASLTKMMTALVAVDRSPLSNPIVATERSRSEPSVIGLDAGDRLSLEDMLYGLLLPSGNDAALAIAETLGGGSIERFVGWMNERAERMGLHNTHFANPTGLDELDHYSSARDLGEIARALLAEPTLARIVGTGRHVVEGPPLYVFATTNPLLSSYPGIEGVKTGFTDDAGRCFVASATRDGHRIIIVLLNSPNITVEGRVLLDAGFEMLRSAALQTRRPGFSGLALVSEARAADDPTLPVVPLAGWELPFLRAFGNASQVTISLAGRPILHWQHG
jgi:D-alanyl-D-alanine carboxypeptidase